MSVSQIDQQVKFFSAETDLKQAALDYAARGIKVFPCIPGAKGPATPNAFYDATTDRATIEAWWTANPGANIGHRPADSGHVVLDLDLYKPGGVDPAFPATMTVASPSGGKHLWFTSAVAYGNGRLAVNVDVRSGNGYVLLPPSAACGGRYVVEDGRAAVAALPEAVACSLRAAEAKAERDIGEPNEDPPGMKEKARAYLAKLIDHPGRYRLAAALACNFGLTDATATALCEEAGLRTEPSGSNASTSWEATLAHARRYGKGELGNGVAFELPEIEPGYAAKIFGGCLPTLAEVIADIGPRILTDDELQASDFQPPEYLWEKLVLRHHVNLLYGDGKVGKTMLALHLALAMQGGIPLFGHATTKLPVLMVLGEDDFGAVKASRAQIAASLGITGSGLDIRYICRPGEDLTIARVDDDGRVVYGAFAAELTDAIKAAGPESIVFLDNAGIVGDLNENFKRPVHTFLRRVLGDLMQATGCTPVVLAHPTAAGIKEGGTGGSRAWRNATRNMLMLTRVDDRDPRRKLTAGGNYGDAFVDLWIDGPVLSLAAGRTGRQDDRLMGMLVMLARAEYDRGFAIKRPRSRKKPGIELGDWHLQPINDALGIDVRPGEVYRQMELAVQRGYLRYVPYTKNGEPAGYTAGNEPWRG